MCEFQQHPNTNTCRMESLLCLLLRLRRGQRSGPLWMSGGVHRRSSLLPPNTLVLQSGTQNWESRFTFKLKLISTSKQQSVGCKVGRSEWSQSTDKSSALETPKPLYLGLEITKAVPGLDSERQRKL